MSNYKYRHLLTAHMNKKELYEKGINTKPKFYELVSHLTSLILEIVQNVLATYLQQQYQSL